MSIIVNIDSQSTIRYRTDCFGTGYTDEPYHIRDHSQYDYGLLGFTPKISNVGTVNLYDIGYNPSGATWEGVYSDSPYVVNPTICDGLIYNGLYTGILSTDSITKVPYKELLFQIPAIAIKRSTVYSSSSTGIRLGRDEITLLDRVYVNPNTLDICGEGIIYENGISQTYNGILEYRVYSTSVYDEIRISLDHSSYSHSTQSGYIVTYNTLLNIFEQTDVSFQIWNVLLNCIYGGILMGVPRDSGEAVFGRVYRHEQNGVYETSYSYNSQWSIYQYLIIPFLSQDEYDAAYAANYKWDDATIQQIDQYIN